MTEIFRSLSCDKRVFIEIIGGDEDGRTYDSLSDDPTEARLVDNILYYTNNGTIGEIMRGSSLTKTLANMDGSATGRKHADEFSYEYEVTERIEEGSEILIRMQFNAHKLTADAESLQMIISSLNFDVECCWNTLKPAIIEETNPDPKLLAIYEHYARRYFFAAITAIEAATFTLKASVLDYCAKHRIELTPEEDAFASERDCNYSQDGTLKDADIRLMDNVTFVVRLIERIHHTEPPFDTNAEWHMLLLLAIRAYDRLAHPRLPRHLVMSHLEVHRMNVAFVGIFERYLAYPKLLEQETSRAQG